MENIIGLLVFGVIAAFAYGTLQMNGANLAVTVGTFGMAGLYLLLLFGQRVTYFRIGDWLELGAEPSRSISQADEGEDVEDWREQNR